MLSRGSRLLIEVVVCVSAVVIVVLVSGIWLCVGDVAGGFNWRSVCCMCSGLLDGQRGLRGVFWVSEGLLSGSVWLLAFLGV